jgi:hypothetical protein
MNRELRARLIRSLELRTRSTWSFCELRARLSIK